jgi:hypothetical protein
MYEGNPSRPSAAFHGRDHGNGRWLGHCSLPQHLYGRLGVREHGYRDGDQVEAE